MDYKKAVETYQKKPTQKTLTEVSEALIAEMTQKEKQNMLSGKLFHMLKNVVFGYLFLGSPFSIPFIGGGCKRLGVPEYRFADGPRGSTVGQSTCFPVASMRAATFDDELEYRVGQTIAKEAIAGGANFFAGICVNVVRNPKWGRAQESYGEDSYLAGKMGATITQAVQEQGMIACPKHFALNSVENLRFHLDVNVDERALREIYIPQFKKCVDAGALSIMGAYNQVNGQYCCENKYLLQEILREEWGFDGFVMSDFNWGIYDCKQSLEAGCDSEMAFPKIYRHIPALLENGELDTYYLDRAVDNILRAMIRMTPHIKPQPKEIVKSKEHMDLAYEAAVKGTVMLKNNGVLPLDTDKPIAVVGPFANRLNTGDKGSSFVNSRKDGVTPYEGLTRVFNQVAVYNGLRTKKALRTAAHAETVIVCVGTDRHQEGEYVFKPGNTDEKSSIIWGGDRKTLHLRKREVELIAALKNAGKQVVVCLSTGSVILPSDFEGYADAILHCFYSGVQGGHALAALLSGEECPSGKLPFTIAHREEDYPSFIEFGEEPCEIDYGYYMGYMLFDKKQNTPMYPFGFGLSYTSFDIWDGYAHWTGDGIQVQARVKNTGARRGAEVVQVYVGSAGAVEDRPVKQLRGFQRVELDPGEEQLVTLNVEYEDLQFYHTKQKEWALDNAYYVYLGTDSYHAKKLPEIIYTRQEIKQAAAF